MATDNNSFEQTTITPWQDIIGGTEADIYAVILYMFSFLACAGNIIVCLTVLKVKYLNMAAGHLIISLAIADIFTGTIMACHATNLMLRGWPFGKVVCKIVGFFKIATICTSLSSLMIISVDRYLCIIYNMTYARQVKRKWIAALLVWFFASLFASFPLYGWGVYTLLPNKSICTVNWMHTPSYTVVLFVGYGFAPIGVMFFSYGGIAWRLRQSRIRVSGGNYGHDENQNGGHSISRDEIKVVKTMSLIVTSLTVLLSPYVLAELVSIGTMTPLPPRVELYITSILYINSSLNPWLYGASNTRFRQAVLSLFQPCLKKCPCECTDSKATNSTHLASGESGDTATTTAGK